MGEKKYFITFGDSRMNAAATRIKTQAENLNFFDEIHVLNEEDLAQQFRDKWGKLMKFGVRGFGYWCWKPYIIRRLLESVPDNSIVIYLDIGCHINPQGVKRLNHYVSELRNDALGIKAFPAYSPSLDVMEKRWTKGDVFDYFDCRHRNDITDSQQLATGHILCKKTEKTINFLRTWESVWESNIALIDDSISQSQNFPEFIENRHDQSIFSILYKLSGGTPLPDKETDSSDFSTMMDYPFWDLRDKGTKERNLFVRLRKYLRSIYIKFRMRQERAKLNTTKKNSKHQ